MRKILCMFGCLLLGISLTACGREKSQPQTDSITVSEPVETQSSEQPENIVADESDDIDKQIQVTTQEGNILVFRLNDSPAAGTMVYEDTEMESRTETRIQPSDGFDTTFEEAMNDSLQEPVREQTNETSSEDKTVTKINVQVGNTTFTATLESNTAVNEFVQMMQEAPVVIDMSDYSGFEKVGSLGTNLTVSNSQTNTQAGDIVLYNGNQIVIFYGSHSWSYTKLGKIDDLAGWTEALGSGDVEVTFSVME